MKNRESLDRKDSKKQSFLGRNRKKIVITIIFLALILLIFGLFNLITQKNEKNNKDINQVANPASRYCIANGGTLDIRTNDEGQYGVCVKNGKECEEWKLFAGECSLE